MPPSKKRPDVEQPLLNESSRVRVDDGSEASRPAVTDPRKLTETQRRALKHQPPNYFGARPPHAASLEEKANPFSRVTYQWISGMISMSAAGDLPTGVVLPLSLEDKSHSLATKFFDYFQGERNGSHRWDDFIDSSADAMRRKDDADSRGVLVWVGYLQQSENPAQLKCAVEWSRAPKAYTAGDTKVLFTDGVVDGEKLFTCSAPAGGGGARATIELPESIEFVHSKSGPAAKTPRAPSVARTLAFACSGLFFTSTPVRILYEVCYLSQPQILEQFVYFIDRRGPSEDWTTQNKWLWGCFVALMFLVTSICSSLCFQKFFHMCMRNGLQARSALMGQLFHKALTISPKDAAHPELSAGRVVNMMSSDVERINEAYGFLQYAWSAPLQLVIAVTLLYMKIGWIVFASIALTIFSIPLQGTIMKLQFTARKNLSAATDRRIKATNELFGAIRVIKFMGWERSFVAAVLKYRDIELGFLRRIQYFRVASSLIVGAVPMLINATVFILYHVTGHTLTPEMVFPVLALLNILRMPFMVIPWMFNLIVTSLVAVNRLNRFLNADDLVTVIRELDAEAEVEIAAQANADGAAGTDPDVEAYSALVTHANLAAYQSVELKERRNVVPGVMSRIKSAVCCCIPKKSKQQKEDDAAKQEKSGGAEEKKFHTVAEKELLHDISAAIPKGKLTVVVGATGSGKTLFLEGLLGHLTVSRGTIASSPSMAYVPQQAWIMNGTVEDNVVFFEKKNQERFDAAATACCLDADLEQLADGSNTEIGERGVNLSGGQRARISLARAVYADREMYLLDDPLSAVDAHVSKSLVEGCFCGTLAGKTRVLVTHQHYVLPRADRVIAMVDGRVGFQGTYREYRTWATEQRLLTPLSTTTPKAAGGNDAASGMMGEPTTTGGGEDSVSASMSQQHTMDLPLPDDEHPDAEEEKPAEGEPKKEEAAKDADKNKGALMSQEERAQGNVPLSMYKRYLRSCGGWARCAFILVVYTLTECINAAVQVWLAIWASGTFELERDTYLYVYLGIVLTSAMCGGIRAYVIYDTGRKASRSLHHDLLESVSAARVSFFDTTPLGRILNRFSKDIDTADNDLPMNYSGFLSTLFSITSSIAIMVVSQPFVIVALIPAGYVYSRVLVFYNAANREIKRVDSINKSPVFALLSEALEGAKTIAAFGKWNNVIAEACHRVDAVFSTSYLQQVVNRWLGLRLDTLGSAIVSVIAFAGVILTMHDIGGLGQHVGMLSLGLTLAMSVTTSLNWFVRQSASVEAGMNSIERIIFYSDDVETEDFRWYGDAGKTNPLPSLPIAKHLLEQQKKTASKKQAVPAPGTDAVTDLSQLGVEFKNVQLRYRAELPLVLKGVDFRIRPRQKVGIVGRTGSGKSTTLLAFLRIVETAGGSLEIGGKPHDAFALEHLRSLFAMIPQEPILFEGTIKSNLDPFDEASPAELKKALDQTNMWARVDKEGGPDKCDVAEGGKNFSVGQRQLLCMARALLKPATAFILMDEATANIDPENDKIIQETIRTAFASRTVITIAHRLATVIDSDQIVVMDAGVAAEVGSPKDLVEVEGGRFRAMIEALPKKEQARLLESARRGRVIDDAEVAAGGGFDERKPSEGSDQEE